MLIASVINLYLYLYLYLFNIQLHLIIQASSRLSTKHKATFNLRYSCGVAQLQR